MDFKIKIVKSIKWNTFSQFTNQIVQLLTTLILARLLGPEVFGLYGMILVFTGFIYLLNDFGLSSVVIQNQNLDKIDLSNIFWFSLFVGAVFTLVTILLSPLIAYFYSEGILKSVMSFMAVGLLLASFSSVPRSLLMKDLMFKELAFADVIANFLSGVFAVFLAYSGFGIWSLASRSVTQPFIADIIIFLYFPYIPVLSLKWSRIKPIMGYSLNILGSNSVNYFSRNVDYLLIGKFLGPEPLGFYTLAYQIMLFPVMQIGQLLLKTLFPVMSKLQNDIKQLRDIFVKTAVYVAIISFPLMGGLFVLSDEFIIVFFGSKWSYVIFLIKIFSIVGLIQSIGTLIPLIYLPLNKPNLLLKWNLLATSISVIGIVLGLTWGIIGVTIAYTLVSIILIYPSLAIPFKLINLKFTYFFQQLKSVSLATIFMCVSTIVIRYCLVEILHINSLLTLLLVTFVGIISYSLVLYMLDSLLCQELIQLLLKSGLKIKYLNKFLP